MPRALEVVSGFTTAPGATFTALTPSTGTSFTVRGTDATKPAWLLSSWGFNITVGELRIRSTKLHDFFSGIRNRITAASTLPLTPSATNAGFAQRLFSQDALTVEITGGGGGEIDTASLLIGYDDLQGVAGRFIDQPTLKKNGLNIVTAEVTVVALTTGAYGGAVAINSSIDNLIANTDYAILGGMTDTRGNGVGITGVDLGNLRIGFPAEPAARNLTANWFEQLAMAFNAPYIPVINSANKAATTIDVSSNNVGGTYIVNLELVQLAPGSVGAGMTGAAVAGAAQPGA